VTQLQDALRNLLLVLHDQVTLDQLETYVIKNAINSDGEVESNTRDGKVYLKYGAEDGFKDDCVMALAISLHYAKQISMGPVSGHVPDRPRILSRTGYWGGAMNELTEMESIVAELDAAEKGLTKRIEQLFGKAGTTDFAKEHALLLDVHDRLKKMVLKPSAEDKEELVHEESK
jgi:hypothetical protein